MKLKAVCLTSCLMVLCACPATISPADSGVPFDAGTEFIKGKYVTRFVQNDGKVVSIAGDLSGATVTVWLETDGGAFVQRSVLGDVNGNYVVPDVPQGQYVFQLGGIFIATNSRVVNLGDNLPGRPNVVVLNPNEGISLTAGNLAPWTSKDELQLASWGAGIGYFSSALSSSILRTHAPDAGDTSLSAMWIDMEGWDAIEGSKGDDLRIFQLSGQVLDGGAVWKSATRSATVTTDLKLNLPTPVATTFTTLDQQAVQVSLDTTSFENARAEVSPAAVTFESRWLLDAQLGGPGADALTGAPDLAILQLPADAGVVDLTMSYGNPFPAEWQPFVTVGTAFEVLYTVPAVDGGTSTARSEVGAISRSIPLADAQNGPIAPAITPVRNVMIDGVPIAQSLPTVSASPVITWDAPALGTATRVDIESIVLRPGTPTTRAHQGTLHAVGTNRVRFPTGFLQPGEVQYLRITALAQPAGWDPTIPLRDVGPPSASAATMTPMFRVAPL
jgi:hypothetical protein